MNKIANQFTSIEQVTNRYLNQKAPESVQTAGVSFEEILKQKQEVSEKRCIIRHVKMLRRVMMIQLFCFFYGLFFGGKAV